VPGSKEVYQTIAPDRTGADFGRSIQCGNLRVAHASKNLFSGVKPGKGWIHGVLLSWKSSINGVSIAQRDRTGNRIQCTQGTQGIEKWLTTESKRIILDDV
jgi:hypothetical protein